MKHYYRVSEAASLLRVSASTLRKYTAQGLIECGRNRAGQRVYTPEAVQAFLAEESKLHSKSESRVVFYIRALDGSPEMLEAQADLLKKEFGEPQRIFSDNTSGLNEEREELNSLLNHAKNNEFDIVAITTEDRLTRFGFSYLERLLNDYSVQIVVLDNQETQREELMKDFMSLISSFSVKLYRLRGKTQKQHLIDAARDRLRDE